jgi:hypothetical protein
MLTMNHSSRYEHFHKTWKSDPQLVSYCLRDVSVKNDLREAIHSFWDIQYDLDSCMAFYNQVHKY